MIHIIVAFGIILRLWNLMIPKSLWGDCWFSMALSQQPLHILIPQALNDVHPPLYPIISHFFSYNEFTLRLLSLLAGVGTIYAVYLLAKTIIDEKVALLASLLVAISPYWLQSSNEIRSYSLLAFLTTMSTYLFFLGKPKRWCFLIMATLTLYTEHLALFWMLSLICYTKPNTWKMRFNLYVILASIPSLLLMAYQSLFRENVFMAGRVSEYATIPMMVKKIGGIANHLACGYRYSMMNWEQILRHSMEWQFCFHAVITLLCIILFIKGIDRVEMSDRMCIFFLMWFLFPIVFLAVFYPIRLDARYLSFCAPVFFILVARGLTND